MRIFEKSFNLKVYGTEKDGHTPFLLKQANESSYEINMIFENFNCYEIIPAPLIDISELFLV